MPKQWVIPDTHGFVKTLRALLEQIRPTKEDELYFLGDYIDRGPDSKGLIDYLIHLKKTGYKARFLKGNHEDYMVQAWDDEQNLKSFLGFKQKNRKKIEWLAVGGKETLKSFGTKNLADVPYEYIEWMRNLEYYIILEKYILVHAGFNFNIDNIYEDTDAMLWCREFEVNLEKTGGRRIIHGHVPVSHEFIDHCIRKDTYTFFDIDNGVYVKNKNGFGNLTALELNSHMLVVQPCVE